MKNVLIRALTVVLILIPLLLPAQDVRVSQIAAAEKMYDLEFTVIKRDSMISAVNNELLYYQYLHKHNLPNDVPMPMWFDPTLPGMHFNTIQQPIKWNIPENVSLPKNKNDLAFYSIPQLASLIKNKKITSVALTKFFIARLKQYGNTLHCVIEITEDVAMKQAKKADENLAKGIYKSPLQGIPYGIKDLFAAKGTHTTWGTPPFRGQLIDRNSFAAQKMEDAGAVLIAKLSLGELAMDDVWFGGQTRNPWNINKGSGGSSAGSAAATVAGLVPFAIGTETYGSIVDPTSRCGATGLRPTFGSISRTGCMALCWSSDKAGPICRSSEDAAIVFAYLHGSDKSDASSKNMPFNYKGSINPSKLKVAYARNYIDTLPAGCTEKQTLAVLRKMGVNPIAIDFPDTLHGDECLSIIIFAEAAAAFDNLTRSNEDDKMVQQNKDRWPNTFRAARFIPAVEYINACRMRYTIMQKVHKMLDQYDIIIAPPETGDQVAITNLTGNPSITIPNGFTKDGMPTSITFIGKLYDEARLIAFAKMYQEQTKFHLQHPKNFN